MLSSKLEGFGFEQSPSDPCVKSLLERGGNKKQKMTVIAHVDDLIVTIKANDVEELRKDPNDSFVTKALASLHTVTVVRCEGTGNTEC